MPQIKKRNSIFSKAVLILTAVFFCLNLFSFSSSALGESKRSIKYASASLPSVSAESAILIDASTGDIVWSKNADRKMSMASTTKIMTALVALENCDIEKTVEVSPDAVGIEGSSIYLYEGERLTMEDLLYAMLLESANDAAAAIAIEVGGNISTFADMMNQKAGELALATTHFTNPHGLDDPEHFTTASELAKIALTAMKNDTFRTIVSTFKKTIPLNETEGVRLLINHNKMLKGYDGAIGVKTGYTKKSGRCLVSAAERDGVELICVTLNAPDDWRDHKEMLDYGFSRLESRTLCEQEEFRYVQPLIGGAEEYTVLSIKEDISVTIPKGSGDIKCIMELPRFSYAPVEKGDIVGRMVYTLDGEVIAEAPIYVSYTVDRIQYKLSFWEKILAFFGK